MRAFWRRAPWSWLSLVLLCPIARGTPPQLYSQPAYESPVRAAPDDLLLLAGQGLSAADTVVYQALVDTTAPVRHPDAVPATASAETGTATIVGATETPNALTVLLPEALRADQSYALWVRTPENEWSAPVKINDARPLWLTPAYVYASARLASLPRYLKVVGQNLQAALGSRTLVRLTGPQSLILSAAPDPAEPEPPSIAHYVARVTLPPHLSPGSYHVDVSRDGVSWVRLAGQNFEVRPDPRPTAEFSVDNDQFGHCRANDGLDDTPCLIRALTAARQAGGGTVYLGPGTWDLVAAGQIGVSPSEGLLIPDGVGLRGAGADLTRLVRHPDWGTSHPTAVLTLSGHNSIRGITFADSKEYRGDVEGPFIQLGDYRQPAALSASGVLPTVTDIVITGNRFDRTWLAIGDSGLPLARLFITYNDIGAYDRGIFLDGRRFNTIQGFRIDDSIIATNTFEPGSYLRGRDGPIASELGAGHRDDFSDNTADGASTKYLYPGDTARGWRAAYFWHLDGNVEMTLISRNTVSCSGDKTGDGEAFSFDNNANTTPLRSVSTILDATDSTITVQGPLIAVQNHGNVPVESYYVGHWIAIVDGAGLGQLRKIVAYRRDAANGDVIFQVSPAWDVVPRPGLSRVSVEREYWQVYTLANTIEHRDPPCLKSNRTRDAGGLISLWGSMADSVIAGNRQYDSDGIVFQQQYGTPERPCADCADFVTNKLFVDIQDNTVDGEYDWGSDCSWSGIWGSLAVGRNGLSPPPTVSYGVSISHNQVIHADAWRGGAISQSLTGDIGPPLYRWPLVSNLLIQHNMISNVQGPPAAASCNKGVVAPRAGIRLPPEPLVWHTVLYDNSCSNVSTPLILGGLDTEVLCRGSAPHSCECHRHDAPGALP